MDQDELEHLRQSEDWDRVFAIVLSATLKIARDWGCSHDTVLPNGQSVEDTIHEAIADLWKKPESIRRDLRITTQLVTKAKQKLWNVLKSKASQGTRSHEESVTSYDDEAYAESNRRTREDRLTEQADRAISLLRTHPNILGKGEHAAVLSALEDGFLKPREIAEVTSIPVSRIYQIKREIEDLYPDVAKQLFEVEIE
ncbi:sigma-70 RNA polymerase sigma factor region 4 domain-containing protein [Rhodopirellula baltica]|uniref:Uncharacterized protein n=1 Tax=Rhodopirellula baltica WH47 TaxID=991778 RepID=F2AWH9_RHOBT|nr:sigma-70 family RNA polymerase sigma factor [Rhodopirellula baltica]EGF25982.1 hypothetical protein RBWH47_04046 [Rhodopirellula baltica WH47]